jgi:hypothetical protein
VGCVNPFAPSYDENLSDRGSLITDQKTIDGLFTNFRYAYTFKDTVIYGKLLSSDFIFTYRDYDNGVDVSWNRDEEMRVTYRLFQNTENLDLVWNNINFISEDSTNVIRSFNLTVTFNPSDIVFLDGRANLLLRKDAGGVWKIINWVDESNY